MAMKKAKTSNSPITIPINKGKSGIKGSELKKWTHSLNSAHKDTIAQKLSFGKRTLRDLENLNNFMIKDIMFLNCSTQCFKCEREYTYTQLKDCKIDK